MPLNYNQIKLLRLKLNDIILDHKNSTAHKI